MTVEDLLVPVSEDAPTGADLDDSNDREFIRQAFEDGEGVDWRTVTDLIERQCAETKDIWLAVYLARGGAQMGRLDVASRGCALLAGLLETYWDTMFPSLEEYGFQGRKGPCESLTRIGPFIGPLRRTVVVEHPRLGQYTGEDLERFEAEGESADGFGMFRRAIEDLGSDSLVATIAVLDEMRAALGRADVVLVDRADGDTGTDFTPTYDAIDAIRRAVARHVPSEVDADDDAAESADPGSSTEPRVAGRVESREDVVRALDMITDYYRRREPGSPIPVALRRVRGWVTMDFMAILRDIAPNSMDEAGSVLVGRPVEEETNTDY